MINIDKLSVEFAAKPLFEDVSFVVNPKECIALVGKNGAGKSTLLKIIAGLQRPTSGSVSMQKETSVGYLPQVMVISDDSTVMQEAEKAFSQVKVMQQRLAAMNDELARRTDYDSDDYLQLVERFTHENERFDMMGGLNYKAEIERTLIGLGFRKEDFSRPTSEFSGGWRMRIELAKLLLAKPDLLLLDEPTNHLDIGSIQWLEQFIQQKANAVILVSHDRAFINNVTNRTIEITCGHINDYKVKYDQYVVLRDERREQQLRAYENQRKEIEETQAFIEKFRYKPTKSNQVQSRMKALERMQIVEVDDIDTARLNLKFPKCARSGDFPLICDEVAKTYGQHLVFSHVNLTIKRGEKVAFVGNNGEGKSTLIKCIMQEIPFDGTLKVGHNVQIGYFAQNQAQLLDPDTTVFDTIDRVATGDMRTKVRDILGAFLFRGDDIDKYVKVLSGGERSRLAMIRLLLQPVNFLILDEPTNHLDMQSKEVLKQAVRDFDGTVVVVSHDRDFLDGLVQRVYEFGGGRVREHIGGIYDFLEKKRLENEGITGINGDVNARTEASSSASPKNSGISVSSGNSGNSGSSGKSGNSGTSGKSVSSGSSSYAEQKELAKLRRKLEKRVSDAEAQIEKIESQIAAIEQKMMTPEGAADSSLFTNHAYLKAQLADIEDEWEQASTELENFQNS